MQLFGFAVPGILLVEPSPGDAWPYEEKELSMSTSYDNVGQIGQLVLVTHDGVYNRKTGRFRLLVVAILHLS